MIRFKDLRDLLDIKFNELFSSISVQDVRQSGSLQRVSGMTQLYFPEIYGLKGGTHPSVKYYPQKWNGYNYWMAYTPYPGVKFENPVIVASQDGESWVTPAGLINPLAEQPATGYNSDTELVLTAEKKLRCYWRWHTATSDQNVLRFRESSDGVTWGDPIDCVLPDIVDPISPCVYVDRSGNYEMWVGTGYAGKMRKLTSTDGITWTGTTLCETSIDSYGYNWHPMVWKEMGLYMCLSCVISNEPTALSNPGDLFFGTSEDGINWKFDVNPVFARGEQGIKNYRVYRSCAVRVGNKHKLFISGYGSESEQIHVTDAILKI